MASSPIDLLVPVPRSVERLGRTWRAAGGGPLSLWQEGSDDPRLAARLGRALGAHFGGPAESAAVAGVRVSIDPGSGTGPEGYRLRLEDGRVQVLAEDDAGAFHAAATLLQLLGASPAGSPPVLPELPELEIRDAPDFRRRGVMLDVSRDRVPTLASLRELVERLAAWKMNELQLYVEHTFAYRDHEEVWAGGSPLTAAELRELGAFCRERHVDLVPNQQSLGHFHRWLVHPRYRPLAECPDGVEHPFATSPEPFSLAPTRPETLAFVRGLHDELLESFDSPFFNVGLDETFDIGLGASRADVEARGKGRVYLEYLKAVHASVAERGLRMQFWGDVILEHPELVPELPPDAIAMAWGYEADHPFPDQTRRFAEAGLEFYVCPGTSTWLSVAGRLANATENLERAARAGRDAGALGYLVTDWGDFGHWQPPTASLAPLLAGASRAWNAGAAPPELGAALDRHVLGRGSAAASLGDVWVEMAHLYRESGAHAVNGSPLFFVMRFAHEGWPHPRIEGLTPDGLDRVRGRIDDLRGNLARVAPECPDGDLVVAEAHWVLDVLRVACDLGSLRLDLGPGRSLAEAAPARRRSLAREQDRVCEALRPLWLARSRPGGLETSLGRFALLRELLA